LLGVVPDDALEELVGAIASGSADRALGLVHTFQKEGRNLQHFCREAIRHMRNLLIARVCGADSDLIAATPDQRPALERAASQFSEEDLTRFFQILLQTDDDLRRKPDPRVHLEMGLLRLINAARLAPLEELLAEVRSGAPASGTSAASSRTTTAAPAGIPILPRREPFSPVAPAPSTPRTQPSQPVASSPRNSMNDTATTDRLQAQQPLNSEQPEIDAPLADVPTQSRLAVPRNRRAPQNRKEQRLRRKLVASRTNKLQKLSN